MSVTDDYFFVNGGSSWEEDAKDLLSLRPDTTRIYNTTRRTTVHHFLRYLKIVSSIDRPVGDLIIVAHSNKKALLQIKLYPDQPGEGEKKWTNYQTLLDAVDNRKINIHSSLSERGSSDPPMFFHIMGCNIGKARPFISKLKEALGGVATVTAPKHGHWIWDKSSYGGIFEYFMYTFVSGSPTELTTHDQVVELFNKEKPAHRRIDDSTIERSEWDSWVPEDALVNTGYKKKIVTAHQSAILGTTISGKKVLRRIPVKYVRWIKKSGPFRVPLSADPGSKSARLAALETYLSTKHAAFTRADFPAWQVWRFSSLADFVAGFDWWQLKWNGRKKKLICKGKRYEYRIYMPVLNPINYQLLFNFYPYAGSGHIFNLDPKEPSKLYEVV